MKFVIVKGKKLENNLTKDQGPIINRGEEPSRKKFVLLVLFYRIASSFPFKFHSNISSRTKDMDDFPTTHTFCDMYPKY